MWASVSTVNNKNVVIGAFYHQPDNHAHQVEHLELSIAQVQDKFRNNKNTTYILGGDFNTVGIVWDDGNTKPGSNQRVANERLLN